ncbi:hypothetical protein ABL78_1278 [Leptomonas seymouri]|uniref:Uncharacterized protein n=1 Tax=Leptomonas seymouri TaxID=5684 RepID=A0A0N1IME2_LEPSE|nr:hypothetical protein ABL78_1278 [Leptomonas seymouri]|eukprot:KPI89613.1 hypothetical protein ABL78_1278 [Leptomonas seymouri]
MRRGTYAQTHNPTGPSLNRWRSPASAPERPSREEPHTSHARSHMRPSSGLRVSSVTPTPERRRNGVLSNSVHGNAPGTSVHHMLTELVDLSHSIAALLEQEGLSPTRALTSSARQQEASLKTHEIERIVRRVEAHFVDKIQSLEAINTTLKDEVRQLRSALQQASTHPEGTKSAATCDIRSGLKEEIEALDALDNAWSSSSKDAAGLTEAEQLRRVLLAEKRQRLRVEEQTQLLTEQHAKVVGTLERRLKKQEEQLYDLIAAIDRGYSGVLPGSPTRSTERSSSHRLSTPRHLLRQQLAQHQQTQRALQEYKENLRYESPLSTQSDEVAAMEELGLGDVRRTLESIRSSKPLTVKDQTQATPGAASKASLSATPAASHPGDEPEVVYTSVSATKVAAPIPPQRQRTASLSTHEVDEITSFLDNITKELESLETA